MSPRRLATGSRGRRWFAAAEPERYAERSSRLPMRITTLPRKGPSGTRLAVPSSRDFSPRTAKLATDGTCAAAGAASLTEADSAELLSVGCGLTASRWPFFP